MTLSIIIVSYNVKYFLEQCLCSIKEAVKNIEAEIIIIDNCSLDNSIAYLQSRFTWIKFIENTSNKGFAKANNKALQMASGKYILFLNPDTILAEDTLEQCIFFYENNSHCGALGVRMLDGSGNFLPESKRSFPSPLVSFYKLVGLSALFPFSRRFGKYGLGYLPEKETQEVDVISGAFMMVSKQILDVTGGFDEQFFMYAEDIDLSYRIQKSGYKNFYLGSATIVHFKGESTKKENLAYVKVFYNAMSLFVKKWYRGGGSWFLRQGLQVGIIMRGFVSAIYVPFKHQKAKPKAEFNKILLAGSTEQARLAAEIVHQYFPDNTTEHVTDLENEITLINKILLVFCISNISYKTSIEWLQQKKAASYKWFGKESHSIVGSSNKNDSGEALIKPSPLS